MKKLLISLLLLSGFGLAHGYGYEHTVKNFSNRSVRVELSYAGCTESEYTLQAGQSRTENVGFCILKRVEAVVNVNGQFIDASPYVGPYTGSSTWIIVADGNEYRVMRGVQ